MSVEAADAFMRIFGMERVMELYIGIDPGATGAIAVLTPSGFLATCKLKETEHDIAEFIRETIVRPDLPCFAYLERVHSMPKQGVSSSFKFGESFGFLRGLLVAHQIPFELVTPQSWQGSMKCRSGGDKNITKGAAQRLFPSLKITHATADALLIAEHCRRERMRKEAA